MGIFRCEMLCNHALEDYVGASETVRRLLIKEDFASLSLSGVGTDAVLCCRSGNWPCEDGTSELGIGKKEKRTKERYSTNCDH